jgi:hypothetical protein
MKFQYKEDCDFSNEGAKVLESVLRTSPTKCEERLIQELMISK